MAVKIKLSMSLRGHPYTDIPNNQVTLALVLTGAVPFIRGLFLLPAQLLGAMSAAALVKGMFPGSIASTNTSLSPGTTIAQGVFIEMFMTAELVFVVLMLAVEKSKDTFLAPIGIGLALFVAMMGGMFCYLPHFSISHFPQTNPIPLSFPTCSTLEKTRLTGYDSRRRLHRRLPQSRAESRSRRRVPPLRRPPLDLLGRTILGGSACCGLLQVCQVFPLRGGESGPGPCEW